MAIDRKIVVGGGNAFLAEGSGQVKKSTVTVTMLKKVGPLESLRSELKPKGDTYVADGAKYYVESMELQPLPGGMGELTVFGSDALDGGTGSAAVEEEYSDQIDMVETRQPLAMHKNFPEDGLGIWLKFLASPIDVQAQGLYRETPASEFSTVSDLPSSLAEWAQLYSRGVREFNVYLPVVRRVSIYKGRPNTSGIGTKGDPGITGIPSGFEWLKTGDTLVRNDTSNRWQRTQTWTGAAEWPDLLYGGGEA